MTRPVTRTVSSAASSAVVALNHQGPNPFNVNLLADVSAGGTLTYTVEYTLDDVFDNAYNPANGVWTAVTSMGAQTADAAGSLSFPVTGVRIRVSAYTSGSVTLTVVQQT